MQSRPRNRGTTRKGSSYILVIGTAMIVTLLALTTLSTQLIQLRHVIGIAHSMQASANVDAGLKLALYKIESDVDWRNTYAHGTWVADQTTTMGTYSIEGLDMEDSLLNDDPTDPITLTATGIYGSSTQRSSVTLVPTKIPLSCLEVGMCAGGSVKIESAKLAYRGTIAANTNIDATGTSEIWPHAQAVSAIIGIGYKQTTTTGVEARELPNPLTVFDYYVANGTAIDIASLPTQTPNLFRDPGMEVGDGGWTHSWETGHNSVVQQTTSEQRQGTASLETSLRTSSTDGPSYYVTHAARSEGTYSVSGWVKLISPSRVRFALNTRVAGVDSWTYTAWVTAGITWTQVTATINAPAWTGLPDHAMLKLETDPADAPMNLFLDDVVLIETGTTPRITHAVLSDGENPYGAADTEGIYVIDCVGQDLNIDHARLKATLVILNPGQLTVGPGPVHWHPVQPNMPSLMVDGNIAVGVSSRGLNEHLNIKNYNPASTPFSSIGANVTQADILPSEMGGIIYSTGSITIDNEMRFRRACVVADSNITIQANTLFDETHAQRCDAPPAFFRYRHDVLRGSIDD